MSPEEDETEITSLLTAQDTLFSSIKQLKAERDQLARVVEAMRDCLELAWEDTRDVRFDSTMLFGHGYDFYGWENLRWEIHSPSASFAVWPDHTAHGRKWSVYGGPDGYLWFQAFDSELAAKNCAVNALTAYAPDHPAVRAHAAFAALGIKEPNS